MAHKELYHIPWPNYRLQIAFNISFSKLLFMQISLGITFRQINKFYMFLQSFKIIQWQFGAFNASAKNSFPDSITVY